MESTYVVCNELDHFLGKQKQWLDGSEPAQLYRSQHRDEALNAAFEAGLKDIHLRSRVEEVEVNAKGLPLVEISEHPLPNAIEISEPALENAVADPQ